MAKKTQKTPTLYDAAADGDAAAVRRLLDGGAKPDVQDPEAIVSPLTAAAEGGHRKVVKLLLDAGADPNYRRTAAFPLAAAAGRGDGAMVRMLLDAGADVAGRDEDGATALFDAAAGGHVKVLRMLLDAGANPRHKDRAGQTALSVAADNERAAAVRLLEPLASAAERKRVAPPAGAASQAVSPDRVMALYKAARAGDRRKVEAMLAAGMPVDETLTNDMTALMGAANQGHLDLVRLLLERGADVNRTDRYHETPLSYAVMFGDIPTVEFLWPLSSAKSRKKAERVVREHQMLPRQYPQWRRWQPPGVPDKPKPRGKR